MQNSNKLDENQKFLVEAFLNQNDQNYDVALKKLQKIGDNLIQMVEKIQSNSEFYLRYMPLMKEERELISQKDYKEFITKNERVLSRNFQKNAYLALLMHQMEEKEAIMQPKRWTFKEQQALAKMIQENVPVEKIIGKFSRHSGEEIQTKYQEIKTQETKKGEIAQFDIANSFF